MALRELHLFAGAGGGILGGILLGHEPVCAVELEAYPRSVLLQRQRDGILPWFPVWDDVCTFDGNPWRGRVDVICGGFPCQDISSAGKGAGIDGARSGLWSEFARIIGEVQPPFIFVENSPLLVSRGLERVLGDLASLGFNAEWGVVGAHHAGAPHKRDRIWILAYSNIGCLHRINTYSRNVGSFPVEGVQRVFRGGDGGEDVAHAACDGRLESGLHGPSDRTKNPERTDGPLGNGCQDATHPHRTGLEEREGAPGEWAHAPATRTGWWATEPALGRVAHGVAHRVDRLKAIGNGQVPAVAELAWNLLMNRARIAEAA